MRTTLVTSGIFCSLLLLSCSRSFEAIDYGKDACAHCRMTIIDDRYAAELITDKGKAYKFDDIICMRQYKSADNQENALYFVEDYLKKEAGAINATTAIYLQHPFFRSPMNGNYAAFATQNDAATIADSLQVQMVKWEELK